MDKLWAPWRSPYVTHGIDNDDEQCVFCRMLGETDDQANLIFVRRQHCFAILNLYPYNNGHSLVMPYRHVCDLKDLQAEERAEVYDLLLYTRDLLDDVLHPAGYNIGLNLGRVAGAGVPGHVHFHVVPRWNGDVNFMPVIADTKVISQSLQVLWEELDKAHRVRR